MPDATIQTNALVAVGTGTSSADRDISNRLRSVSFNEEFEDHDVTVMGSTTRIRAVGLGEAVMEGELLQSYTTADGGENIDALMQTLRDLSATGQKFLVRYRPVNAARNASNPEYSMLVVSTQRNIADGEVGSVQMNPFTFLSAGDVTRTTATS